MLGSTDNVEKVRKNVRKALSILEFKYEETDGNFLLGAMGDDLPISMIISPDKDNATLNIYCALMFEIPTETRDDLILALNVVNNKINNGSFYMSTEDNRIFFKIVHSFHDSAPSPDTIAHLIMIAFQTVDLNDGSLKDLIPKFSIKDLMYS